MRAVGNHFLRVGAAKAEPSPVTGLRDMLATAFAADIAAVTPMVCDMMREDLSAAVTTPATRTVIAAAVDKLHAHSGGLAMECARTFRALFDARLAAGRRPRGGRLPSGLEIMGESQLELEIAVDQCIARLREQVGPDAFRLATRVSAMLGNPALDEADNPVAVRIFARALAGALEAIELAAAERLIVFKAFGPPLLAIAPDLYNQANGMLADLGVVPDTQVHPAGAQAARPPQREASPLLDERTLALILDRLLSGHRASFPSRSAVML